jgi:molecular chaperone GrpE
MNDDTATSAPPFDEQSDAHDAASQHSGGEDLLAAELAAALADAKESKEKYLYAMADFENYKKRVERDLSRIAMDGRKAVLRKVLPVLDNLERALAFEDSDGVRGGLQATLRMFESTLAGENVKAVSLKGQPFDPAFAEAIATQPTPDGVDDDTILEEAHKAYTIGDEVLRPAQVIVAKAP